MSCVPLKGAVIGDIFSKGPGVGTVHSAGRFLTRTFAVNDVKNVMPRITRMVLY